jgi:mercuric ion transport protein
VRREVLAGLGGVGAAVAGTLCCIGPLMVVTFGVGAGLAATFEPLRPLFGVLMVAAFALAFYSVYGKRAVVDSATAAACAPGEACARPRSRTREKAILWVALVMAIVIWTFPTWSTWLV